MTTIQSRTAVSFRFPIFALFCLAILFLLTSPADVRSNNAKDDLRRAEGEFNLANFGGALAIVNRLTSEGSLSGDDLRDAFALKARCEAEFGNRSDAMAAFCRVIDIDSKWRPNPTLYTPTEIAIFEEAKAGCLAADEKREGSGSRYGADNGGGGSRKWWYIGGGVLAAVLVLALAGGGGGDDGPAGTPDPDLTDFPDPPTN